MSAAPGAPAPRPMAFFLRCWEYARDGCDVEGSDVQEWGEEFGLLMKVSVAAPCGEGCWCEEYYGEFPVDCYRPVEGGGAPTPAMLEPTEAMKRAAWDAISAMANSGASPGVFEDAWITSVLRAALSACGAGAPGTP